MRRAANITELSELVTEFSTAVARQLKAHDIENRFYEDGDLLIPVDRVVPDIKIRFDPEDEHYLFINLMTWVALEVPPSERLLRTLNEFNHQHLGVKLLYAESSQELKLCRDLRPDDISDERRLLEELHYLADAADHAAEWFGRVPGSGRRPSSIWSDPERPRALNALRDVPLR